MNAKQVARRGERLAYAVGLQGHRQSYLNLLGDLFDLEPMVGRMTPSLFKRLVRADQVLFTSLDDGMYAFAAVSLMRSLAGRPTAALFLRAQKCFDSGNWRYGLKRHAFATMRRLPHLTIATITPFDVAPRYAEVANVGVCDPQYWDRYADLAIRQPTTTDLSALVLAHASGRQICCALGSIGTGKGLRFLAETLESYPEITEKILIVCAGHVPYHGLELARRLEKAGALLIGRFLTDAELESLYSVADVVWACYAPDYDQASGIFGRALQFGIPPLVRQGSVIEAFATSNGVRSISVRFGSRRELSRSLLSMCSHKPPKIGSSPTDLTKLVGEWRRQFENTIRAALEGQCS